MATTGSSGAVKRLVAPLAIAIAGVCAGFLFYNFRPGHIFMGDTGSLVGRINREVQQVLETADEAATAVSEVRS